MMTAADYRFLMFCIWAAFGGITAVGIIVGAPLALAAVLLAGCATSTALLWIAWAQRREQDWLMTRDRTPYHPQARQVSAGLLTDDGRPAQDDASEVEL